MGDADLWSLLLVTLAAIAVLLQMVSVASPPSESPVDRALRRWAEVVRRSLRR